MDAKTKIEGLVNVKIANGRIPRHEAFSLVLRENPSLREELIASHNNRPVPQGVAPSTAPVANIAKKELDRIAGEKAAKGMARHEAFSLAMKERPDLREAMLQQQNESIASRESVNTRPTERSLQVVDRSPPAKKKGATVRVLNLGLPLRHYEVAHKLQ